MAKSRAYSFTINNYSDEDIQVVEDLAKDAQYLVYGLEVGKQGTPHIQGFVYFQFCRSFKALKQVLPRAHIEQCKASVLANADYCKKEGNFKEFGTRPRQGARVDLSSIVEHGSLRTLCSSDASYQAIRMLEKRLTYLEVERDFKPFVVWFYGGTGVGKSRSVHECFPRVFKPKSFKWWEGYDAHEHVLIDDIRGDYCKFHELLVLIDRYGYRVECKGGSRQLRATHMFFTCPYHPADLYRGKSHEDIQQLLRRIDRIVHVTCVNGVEIHHIVN